MLAEPCVLVLLWLWDRLEVEHATCFSNLYRLAALYVYGGIYHDAKIWLSPPGLAGVVRAFGTYDLVFEERPSGAAVPLPRQTTIPSSNDIVPMSPLSSA